MFKVCKEKTFYDIGVNIRLLLRLQNFKFNYMKFFNAFICLLILFGCKNELNTPVDNKLTAKGIIDRAIEVAGGEKFANSEISFNFRDKAYFARRHKGDFLLMRIAKMNNGHSVVDKLTNKDFKRDINNKMVPLSDSLKIRYTASVNSVHYFSVLPFGLNDKAVNKELLGEEQINKETYYKVQITFDEDGGGEDFEDVFVYWIHKESFKPDFLAYSYNEDDGKGMRFRKAYNERYVNGLRFVDYENFKPQNEEVQLNDLAKAHKNSQLKLVSKIELEDIKVKLINP